MTRMLSPPPPPEKGDLLEVGLIFLGVLGRGEASLQKYVKTMGGLCFEVLES